MASDGRQQVGARREDGERARASDGDVFVAIDVGAGGAGGGDLSHGGHAADHRHGLRRERGLAAVGGLARGDPEQVRAEGVEPPVHLRLPGAGDADHRDHGGDADGDAESGEEGTQGAGPQARPAEAYDVGGPEACGAEP